MLSNTQFSMAIHVLTALAYNEGRVLASEDLARTVGSNPSFVRGLIGRLRDAGLAETHLGKGGGTTLAKPAAQITLRDVYRATETHPAVKTHECDGKSPCAVAQGMHELLKEVSERLERVLGAELEEMTIADLMRNHVKRTA